MYLNIKMFQMMGFVAALFFPNVGLWHAADQILYTLTENGKKSCSIFMDDRRIKGLWLT